VIFKSRSGKLMGCHKCSCRCFQMGDADHFGGRVPRDKGKVYYFNGHLPVFMHEGRDLATFRMV
jgi:hypothetical protein